jgi:RNAse (barnase) inhibitor barstar
MIVDKISIDCGRIHDWPSFHSEFAEAFGFPDFYGHNLDAWMDCLTSLDAPEDGLTKVHCLPGSVLTIELQNVSQIKAQFPEQYSAIVECSAFVNWRRIETGSTAVLALSFWARW